MSRSCSVLLTDHPWPDLDLENQILGQAGHNLVAGPIVAGSETDIEALVAASSPSAIMTCWAPVSRKAIEYCDDLAVVARIGVGLDNIDIAAATERGAWVTNVPDYCVQEVSDHAMAFALDHCRGISRLSATTRDGEWHSNADGLLRLADQVVGILGYGRIGRETARKFVAMGCRVLIYDHHFEPDGSTVEGATLAQILDECDMIVVHVPLTPDTVGLLDKSFFDAARRRPFIINVSRGPIVDNEALLGALGARQIRGAALDVVDGEPNPPADLLTHPHVISTPHVAYASSASMTQLRRRACEEVIRVLSHQQPLHPRNRPHGR